MSPIPTVLVASLSYLSIVGGSSLAMTEKMSHPNVLYLCIEDTGPFLGCYGYEPVRTPNIDQLARDSVLAHPPWLSGSTFIPR